MLPGGPKPPPGIPQEARDSYLKFLCCPMDEPERLLQAVDRYTHTVETLSHLNEHVDRHLARAISQSLSKLLRLQSRFPLQQQQWIQAAARYYFLHDDARHDLEDPDGLRDDALVVNAVAQAMGRNDLVIPM